MAKFPSILSLKDYIGQSLGTSHWITIDQDQINTFAAVTDDPQWIHTDTEKAASSPFGSTIVHGFFVLSLLSPFLRSILQVEGVGMGINYGLNRVRFTSPVPVNSRLQAEASLLSYEDVDQGARLTLEVIISREEQDKPVCVAEAITLLYNAS